MSTASVTSWLGTLLFGTSKLNIAVFHRVRLQSTFTCDVDCSRANNANGSLFT